MNPKARGVQKQGPPWMSLNWGEKVQLTLGVHHWSKGRPLWSKHAWPRLLGGGMDASREWEAENGLLFLTCLESDSTSPCPHADNSCL